MRFIILVITAFVLFFGSTLSSFGQVLPGNKCGIVHCIPLLPKFNEDKADKKKRNVIVNSETNSSDSDKSNNPKFDEKLAKKVGANEHGYKMYYLLQLRKPGNLNEKRIKEKLNSYVKNNKDIEGAMVLFEQHIMTFAKLETEKIVLAGGGVTYSDEIAYLYIIDSDQLEKAKKIIQENPYVKMGVYELSINEIASSAALMLVPDLHEKVQKIKSVTDGDDVKTKVELEQ